MRIGIVTYWTIKENYGQIMQMYALSTFFLKHYGYDGYADPTTEKSLATRILNAIKRPRKITSYFKARKIILQ